MPEPVHVIGAGISGLGAAHYLKQAGVRAIVHEAGPVVGGRAGHVRAGDLTFETGGKNFSTAWTRFGALLDEFGIDEFEPQHPGFHIVMKDRLVALSKERTLSGDLRLFRLLGLRGALQLNSFLTTARRNAGRLNYSGGLIEEIEQRLDHATIDRHFTRTVSDGPVRLFSIIMGAAEPSELYPSLLMLFASGFGKGEHRAIKGGIGRFHARLAKAKTIRFGSRIERVLVEGGRVVGLRIVAGGRAETIPASRVVCALPAHQMKTLIDLPAYARVAADRIRYHPLALINAVYDGPVFRDGVHSIMFEPGSILGHCSANRLDTPEHVRFTLSGQAARDVLDLADDELIAAAENAFSERLPIRARRIRAHIARHDGGICGYAPHFTSVKRDLLRGIAAIGGFDIAGDYLEGHTMEGCLASAEAGVRRLLADRTLPVRQAPMRSRSHDLETQMTLQAAS